MFLWSVETLRLGNCLFLFLLSEITRLRARSTSMLRRRSSENEAAPPRARDDSLACLSISRPVSLFDLTMPSCECDAGGIGEAGTFQGYCERCATHRYREVELSIRYRVPIATLPDNVLLRLSLDVCYVTASLPSKRSSGGWGGAKMSDVEQVEMRSFRVDRARRS